MTDGTINFHESYDHILDGLPEGEAVNLARTLERIGCDYLGNRGPDSHLPRAVGAAAGAWLAGHEAVADLDAELVGLLNSES